MRQYSIDRVELAWAALDFKEGLAQGSSITEARASQSWLMKPTGMGRIVRVFNPDKSGTLSVVVDQESKLHQQLRTIAIADALTRDKVFTGTLIDNSTTEAWTYLNMFILTEPDETRGTESATFTWMFGFERVDKVPALGDVNVVGN